MLSRLFSALGFIQSIPTSQSGADDQLDTTGDLSASFVAGAKAPASSEDDQQEQQDRRAQIAQRELVWPGKTETIHIQNSDSEDGRFDLTVTDLPAALYVRRPPVGGRWQPEGGVLLRPGEEASCEIVFVAASQGLAAGNTAFSIVLTRFDPRRSTDSGEIIEECPLRWVPLPTPNDLKLSLLPAKVVTRPWRRKALVRVQMLNRSYLPPVVSLQVDRAPAKELLTKEPESVGSLSHSLESRTAGSWYCLLPPAADRGSYFVGVTGNARVGEGLELGLSPTKPIYVQYVPWLRKGRDWLLIFFGLVLLLWLAWGFPVQKRATVAVTLNFAGVVGGNAPYGGSIHDLAPQMILQNDDGTDDTDSKAPLIVSANGNTVIFKTPAYWYGWRWALGSHIGWNGFSRKPKHYRLQLTAPAAGSVFDKYDFTPFTQGANASGSYSVTYAHSIFSDWKEGSTFRVFRSDSALAKIYISDWGGLSNSTKNIQELTITFPQAQPAIPPMTVDVERDATGHIQPTTIDLTNYVPPGPSQHIHLQATALNTVISNVAIIDISRGKRPLTVHMAFPASAVPPAATGAGPGALGALGGPGGGGGRAGAAGGGGGGGAIPPLPVALPGGNPHTPKLGEVGALPPLAVLTMSKRPENAPAPSEATHVTAVQSKKTQNLVFSQLGGDAKLASLPKQDVFTDPNATSYDLLYYEHNNQLKQQADTEITANAKDGLAHAVKAYSLLRSYYENTSNKAFLDQASSEAATAITDAPTSAQPARAQALAMIVQAGIYEIAHPDDQQAIFDKYSASQQVDKFVPLSYIREASYFLGQVSSQEDADTVSKLFQCALDAATNQREAAYSLSKYAQFLHAFKRDDEAKIQLQEAITEDPTIVTTNDSIGKLATALGLPGH